MMPPVCLRPQHQQSDIQTVNARGVLAYGIWASGYDLGLRFADQATHAGRFGTPLHILAECARSCRRGAADEMRLLGRGDHPVARGGE